MLSVTSAGGIPNEIVFEQRTPSTMRGHLVLNVNAPEESFSATAALSSTPNGSVSSRHRPGYPRHFLWRLRILEGSTMLCSKLCGLLTVSRPGEGVSERISVTLAVRLGSTTNIIPVESEDVHFDGSGYYITAASASLPASLRRESKLKVQWIELHQSASAGSGSSPARKDTAQLDVADAQKALQSSTRDRSLLDNMFRVGASKVVTHDVVCSFSFIPPSQRSTSKFTQSSLSHPTDSRDDVCIPIASREGSTAIASSRGPSPLASTPRRQFPRTQSGSSSPGSGRAQGKTSAGHSAARLGRAESERHFSKTSFWVGVVVGATFGVTAVVASLDRATRHELSRRWKLPDAFTTWCGTRIASAMQSIQHFAQSKRVLSSGSTTPSGSAGIQSNTR